MRSGLGWRSLNPVEAVDAVHSIENKEMLIRIAHEARNPEARRLALLKVGDKGLMAVFAQSDSSPIVRRRLVRELDDIELVSRIAENDDDRSVRESASQRLAQLEELREKNDPHLTDERSMSHRKEMQEVLAQVRFAKNRLAGITMEMDQEGKETAGLDEALEGLDDVADIIADFLDEDA